MAKTEAEKRQQLFMEKTAEEKRRLRARMTRIESVIDGLKEMLKVKKDSSQIRELARLENELAGIRRELQNL